MTLLSSVEDVLDDAQRAMANVSDTAHGATNEHIEWLYRQLANLIKCLRAYISDIDDGIELSEMGFFNDVEFLDMIEDISVQIANIKGLIQTAKLLER